MFRRSSPYGRQDSLVQRLDQFIRMWHRGPGRIMLSMIVKDLFNESYDVVLKIISLLTAAVTIKRR